MSNVVSEPVALLHWLASLAPTRLTGTDDERRVQQAITDRLTARGFVAKVTPFRFPRHIYGSLALHFGLGMVGCALAAYVPAAAAVLLCVVAGSYYAEAVHRRHVLRALWPKVDTQNAVLTHPASLPMRQRIVLLAHVDSAFTGLMFHPPVLKAIAAPPPRFLPFLRKQLFLPFAALLAAAALAAIATLVAVPSWSWLVLLLPMLPVVVLNAEIVLRNRVVPGAADNLSGCAAVITLAERWARAPVADVELVVAFTGAEEAGTGGAAHLARTAGWDPASTVVLALDTLTNGELFLLEEGELAPVPQPPELVAAVHRAAAELGVPAPPRYPVPAGATDALPFLVAGYRAIALTCIDPVQHAPRHYHHPHDTADRIDPAQLRASTELAATLIDVLAGRAERRAAA